MSSALAPYWSPKHRRPIDYTFMTSQQPAVVKIMDGGAPDYQFAMGLSSKPLILARDWAISEQKGDMLADPVGLGVRHAEFWLNKQREFGFDARNTLCLGINEPAIWDMGVPSALSQYTVSFLAELSKRGLRGGALQLSVGWPANTSPGSSPNWAIFPGVEQAIKQYNGALLVHEYWADQGPSEMWGWWGGRFMSCPWQVPIIIAECGIDMGVKKDGLPFEQRGWRAVINDAGRYANELREYVLRCKVDPRFFAATVFELDFASSEWWSFDIEPAALQISLATKDVQANSWFQGSQPVPIPPEPPVFPPAAVTLPLARGSYHVTQHFYQNPQDYAQFGLPGHNGTDLGVPQGKDVLSMAAGSVAYVDKDKDYGYYIRIWHKELGCHSFYAHLSELPKLKVGDRVSAGQKIALSGNTGNSTGPHLHIEIRLCTPTGAYRANTPMASGRIDPESWLATYGLKL